MQYVDNVWFSKSLLTPSHLKTPLLSSFLGLKQFVWHFDNNRTLESSYLELVTAGILMLEKIK